MFNEKHVVNYSSHLNSLYQDAPGWCSLVQELLNATGDALSLAQDLVQVLGAEDVPERGLGQHPRAVVAVLHISHRDRGVGDSEKHHRVHRHCHTVLGENLKRFWITRLLLCTLHIQTSCGGTLKVWVLMSIFSYTSTQGRMKNTPGPRVPPVSSNPRRNITALSYSWHELSEEVRDIFPQLVPGPPWPRTWGRAAWRPAPAALSRGWGGRPRYWGPPHTADWTGRAKDREREMFRCWEENTGYHSKYWQFLSML